MKIISWLRLICILIVCMSFAVEWECCVCESSTPRSTPAPKPTPWPEQFHALLYMNMSDTRLKLSDLWYDWHKGLNANIFHKQLGEVLYDIEWDNGTSFYYTLGPNASCSVMDFGVGILRPDFLDGAVYLGTQITDGFLCNVWEKIDFIWYYEDVVSKRPVRWDFYDGISSHVMTFEVGAVLPDPVSQAPEYCFTPGQPQDADKYIFKNHLSYINLPTHKGPDSRYYALHRISK